MAEAQNLTNVRLLPDGGWLCNIDLKLPGEDWEAAEYCARRGDKAPVNLWIIEQIDAAQWSEVSLVAELKFNRDTKYLQLEIVKVEPAA